MDAITLVFFLILFVGFILFIIYVLHSVTLLYLPQISSLENYPEGIYFYFLQGLKYYLPQKFSCYNFSSTLPNTSFCVLSNLSNFSDICFYGNNTANLSCPVNVINLSNTTLQSFLNNNYTLINYSNVYFFVYGNKLIILANYSNFPSSLILKILQDYYSNSFAISVPQYEYLMSNISYMLNRLRIQSILLSDYPQICVEYLRPSNNLQITLYLRAYSCPSSYLQSVLENSTQYIKKVDSLSYDTYIHLYLFPNPQTTQVSLLNSLLNYLYTKLSVCSRVENVQASYAMFKIGNCQPYQSWYFYVARRTLVPSLASFNYSLSRRGNLTLLEINYTIPVLYFRVKV